MARRVQWNTLSKFVPRWYQHNLFVRLDRGIHKLDGGYKRICCVWHRRAGKDLAMINYEAKEALRRVGTYWHVFPTQRQARKAIWDGITSEGIKIVDQAFPKEIVARKLNDEMMIELKNGSVWRLVGGDAYDGLVGSNVAGVVFSEFAITDPAAWDYVRPILAESGGFAVFISTPRGENHWYELCEMAKAHPSWHYELLTVEDTKAIPLSIIQEERETGMPEERVRQEYYCDFTAANVGSVFGGQLEVIQKKGFITDVPYNPNYPVDTSWDLGVVAQTAIVFSQEINGFNHVIDFHCEPGKGKSLPYFLGLCREKGYAFGRHVGPHDIDREWIGSGETPMEIAANHGFHFVAAPRLNLDTTLPMAQNLILRSKFDQTNCEYLIKCLKHYQYEWDEELKVFGNNPVKDWSSDPVDAFRTGAQAGSLYGKVSDWSSDSKKIKIPKSNIAAQQMGLGDQWNMGHNGGPPLDDDGYDPFASM